MQQVSPPRRMTEWEELVLYVILTCQEVSTYQTPNTSNERKPVNVILTCDKVGKEHAFIHIFQFCPVSNICPTRMPCYGCICGTQHDSSPPHCSLCRCKNCVVAQIEIDVACCIPHLLCTPRISCMCRRCVFVFPYFFRSRGILPSCTSSQWLQINSGDIAMAASSSASSTAPCMRLPR